MSLPLAGKRIGLLTASASRQGGGVFEAVVAQAGLIRALGGEAVIHALFDSDCERDRARFGDCEVVHAPVIGPRLIGFAPSLVPGLIASDLDCVHLHGIWMYPSRAGCLWARQTGKPYIISVHGMLDPWITARGRWKKALARWGYERESWSGATAFHALTARESLDIARETGWDDSLVIPNAGPPVCAPDTRPRGVDIVYIGRVHPKKNLVALVHGWRLAQRPGGARLRIAGWGSDADVADLRAAMDGGDGSVEFLGPVFGDAKQALIGDARFMVLPSHSEGLPMAILEAWAAGTPAIMTGECNLPEGFASGAALECGYDAQAIGQAITRAFALGEAGWAAMAAAARALAGGPFSSAAIAAQWGGAYSSAITGGDAR